MDEKNVTRSRWKVRSATPEDGPAITQMFNKVFPEDRSIDHWKWKFLDNPTGKFCVAVAEDGNQIVGHYAIVPTWMNLSGQRVMGGQSVDTMTHPDYRKEGIFVSLAKQCLEQAASEGIRMLYGFPNEQSYGSFVSRLGWHDLGRLRRLTAILNVSGIIKRRTKSAAIATAAAKPASLLVGLLRRPRSFQFSKNVEIKKVDVVDGRFDALWASIKDHTTASLWKDSTYLRWRYFACPDRDYLVLIAQEDGFLVGFIVIRRLGMLEPNGCIARLVDFLCLPGRVVAGALLVREALHFLKDQGVDAATWYAFENSLWYRFFVNEGFFLRRKDSLPFIVQTPEVNTLPAFPLRANEWYLVPGDIDIF